MVNFLNLFITFITLNYADFLQNIKASNNNSFKQKTKKILTLENIKKEKYEINGTILFCSPDSTFEDKCVKITEIEYDGVEIQFMNENGLPIRINESELHELMDADLRFKGHDYRFRIISIVFKVTAFIEEKCFHTTLWYGCLMDSQKVSNSLHDQLLKSFRLLRSHSFKKYIMLSPNCFDNICDVDVLKSRQRKYDLYNLTIDKDSKTYNINHFIFDCVFYLEVCSKIYYRAINRGMIKTYIGKNTNQCNMNEKILFFCTKTNKLQNKNNLENQNVPENI